MSNNSSDHYIYYLKFCFMCDDGKAHTLKFSGVNHLVDVLYLRRIITSFINNKDLFDPKPILPEWVKLVTINTHLYDIKDD